MIIGGIQKVSLIDYPGEISSVLFTRGCNMRCIYCHNSDLVLPERYAVPVKEDEVFRFLRSRTGRIKAVVISGGEPTLHRDLPEFIERVKQLGYKVKLDTNGTNPDMLKDLIHENLVDFVAMDIKAPFEKYLSICGVKVDISKIIQSIKIIKKTSIPYEFRATVLKGIHTAEDIKKMEDIAGSPVKLQGFKLSGDVLDEKLTSDSEFSESELIDL